MTKTRQVISNTCCGELTVEIEDDEMRSRYYDDPSERFRAAARQYGDAIEHHLGCLCTLAGRRCTGCPDSDCCIGSPEGTPHLLDHKTRFVRNGRTTAIIGQPYIQRNGNEGFLLDEETIAKATDFCRRHGIKMQLSPEQSWHCPGPPYGLGYTVAAIFT
jgi:hypothetical protein